MCLAIFAGLDVLGFLLGAVRTLPLASLGTFGSGLSVQGLCQCLLFS